MKKQIRKVLNGLQTRLTITYTIVTVALLLIYTITLLGWLMWWLNSERANEIEYLENVFQHVAPTAKIYFEQNDFEGLQSWADQRYQSKLAAPAETETADIEAAPFAANHPFFILNTDGEIVALAPFESDMIGTTYIPPNQVSAEWFREQSLNQTVDILDQYRLLNDGSWFVIFPVQAEVGSKAWGTLVLNIEPSPSFLNAFLPAFGVLVWVSALILFIVVIPMGALFGYIMAKNLTQRLAKLEAVADAYSQGNFSVETEDKSKDEIGRLGVRLKQMAQQIEGLLDNRQELAALEERNRLARELHDTVKQQNFATLMQVRAAKNLAYEKRDSEVALEHLEMAENMLKQSQQDLKAVIDELRPPQLEGHGLPKALRQLTHGWTKHSNIPTNLAIQGERPVPLSIEQTLYRIAQETFANIDRHSEAKQVDIELSYQPHSVSLTVRDDGKGFDLEAAKRGFGLSSMEQRVTEAGGRLTITSGENKGTQVTAEITL